MGLGATHFSASGSWSPEYGQDGDDHRYPTQFRYASGFDQSMANAEAPAPVVVHTARAGGITQFALGSGKHLEKQDPLCAGHGFK